MSGVRSQCETIAALLQRGHDPTPIEDTPPPLVRLVPLAPEIVATLHDFAPWRVAARKVEMTAEVFHLFALDQLSRDIARAAGLPLVAIRALLDAMPLEYLPLLDDYCGWSALADIVAAKLGILDEDNPLLPFPPN